MTPRDVCLGTSTETLVAVAASSLLLLVRLFSRRTSQNRKRDLTCIDVGLMH